MLIDPQYAAAPEGASLQRARGRGRIVAKQRDGRTALDRLFQEGCAKIRTPRTHGQSLSAVLINASGGLTGGDRVEWSAEAGPGTHLVATTQACERIYRATGAEPARVDTALSVAAGARLDWLPQETILFEGGRLARTLTVDLAPNARFLGLEAIILGRQAMGEDALHAALVEDWRIRRDGKLVHAEANRLEPGARRPRLAPALLAGAGAFATLCYVGPDAERAHALLSAAIAGLPDCAASRIDDKLVLRALAPSGYRLRRVLAPAIVALSGDGAVPRLWSL